MKKPGKSTKKHVPTVTDLGKFKSGVDDVLASSAQFSALCQASSGTGAAVNAVYTLLERNESISRTDKAVIELQLISGCRIGSVLQITPDDISEDGMIRIPPEKGGVAVIARPFVYRSVWLAIKRTGMHISTFRDRFYFYRLYKKHGIYAHIEGNDKLSVTHVLRHAALAGTEQLNITDRERANYAGQKSEKSQNAYLPGRKKRSTTTKRNKR